jgi:cytidylate kinase
VSSRAAGPSACSAPPDALEAPRATASPRKIAQIAGGPGRKTRADTLRVLITAAPDTRRARIRAAREVTEKEAGKLLTRGDAHRADYFKRFYRVPAELPTHYDIVVNSDRLSVEQAADIILQTASSAPASA